MKNEDVSEMRSYGGGRYVHLHELRSDACGRRAEREGAACEREEGLE